MSEGITTPQTCGSCGARAKRLPLAIGPPKPINSFHFHQDQVVCSPWNHVDRFQSNHMSLPVGTLNFHLTASSRGKGRDGRRVAFCPAPHRMYRHVQMESQQSCRTCFLRNSEQQPIFLRTSSLHLCFQTSNTWKQLRFS